MTLDKTIGRRATPKGRRPVHHSGLLGLETWAGLEGVPAIAARTRAHLSTPGSGLATQMADHLEAFNSTSDIVPYSGDYRLAHTEAQFQLCNSVRLAFYGFYSQACVTLRSVCELSLMQSTLPEGAASTDAEVNTVWFLGDRARVAGRLSPEIADSQEAWSVRGARIPSWQSMMSRLLSSDLARRFDEETGVGARLRETFESLNPFVHERGYLRSAMGLSGGSNLPGFSEEALCQYASHRMRVAQLSVSILLLAFLPTATFHPDAAAGFIDPTDIGIALRVLPQKDAQLLRKIYVDLSVAAESSNGCIQSDGAPRGR